MRKQSAAKMPSRSAMPVSVGKALEGLLAELRSVIREARQQALRAVDVIQVRTCWLVGRHIVEFEQGGAGRAAYGRGLLTELSARLTAEFGRGFDASNLRDRRLFAFERNGISQIMQPSLRFADLNRFYVPRPPVNEQEAVARQIERECSKLNAALARTEREIALTQEYRTRLTADVVTGKLDVRAAAAKRPEVAAVSSADSCDNGDLAENLEPEEE